MSESPWIVVGLGNPGTEYEATRHNAGFMVVDALASYAGIRLKRNEFQAVIGEGEIDGEKVLLAKPQTFMNLSGESVAGITARKGGLGRLIVIVDDLALPFGVIRLRRKGSHGGHNGLRSINDCLKTSDYFRLRIGISPDHQLSNTKRFVLAPFSKSERADLPDVISRSAQAVRTVIKDGIDRAMSEFNG